MDNYYDDQTGEWVTSQSRYDSVLAEPRFDAIRDHDIQQWPSDRAWALILELLAAVPEDTVSYVGSGPLEDFVRRHAVEFISKLEAELPRNPRLQSAALEMYLTRGDLPSSIEARLAAALGPRFSFLDSSANHAD